MVKHVNYRNFWINPEPILINFFQPLLTEVYQEQISFLSNDEESADLEIISVFEPPKSLIQKIVSRMRFSIKKKEKANIQRKPPIPKKKIWFSGENKRPDLTNGFDVYLGFDVDNFIPGHLHLPLWVINLNWFGLNNTNERTSGFSTDFELLKSRKVLEQELEKRKFCCVFINNPEEVRMGMIQELSKIGEVDVFGAVSGKIVSDKVSLGKEYRFILAFENAIYPGYVTEKLLEAYETTAFPLYWGIDRDQYFNPASYLNLFDYETFASFVEEVSRLNNNLTELASRINQPLLLKTFDLDKLVKSMRELLL